MDEALVDDPRGHPVADPDAADLDRDELRGLVRRARREVDEGLLPSCQLAVAHQGRLVACRTIGAPPTSRYVTYSVTKALTAGSVWQVLGAGLLHRKTRVGDVVDALGASALAAVTVEQLLTHTAGIPSARLDPGDWEDRARRLECFADWHLEWEPGTRFVYHATSAHWLLAHLVEAATGEDFRAHLRRTVLDPLGLADLQLGTPVEDQDDVLDAVPVGDPPDAAEAEAVGESVGLDVSAIGVSDADLLSQNDPSVRTVGQPAGGAIGRAADVASYYQALLANPDQLFDPEVLTAGTSEVLCDLPDPMTGAPANRTLGLVLAGDDDRAVLRGFGETSSPRTFGHMGAGGQVAWADPASGLSFAYLTNGLDRNPIRMGARGVALSTRAGSVVDNGGRTP